MPETTSIQSWEQSIRSTVANIGATNPEDVCTYPIPALNTILGGIGPGEVVAVAGQSGEGKSDFLRLVAEHNAEHNRRVHVYQFEMDSDENTRRYLLRKLNKSRTERKETPISGVDLFLNRITPWDRAELEKIMEEEASKSFPLYTYCGQSLKIGDFLNDVTQNLTPEPPRLIVLDHIHYFAGDIAESENESISKAMREIRQWTKATKIPLILAAHLRKPSKRGEDATPSDIYGSSNIHKEATTCIILKRGKGETTFSVWKSRVGGDYKRFEVTFDPITKLWMGQPKNERTVFESGVAFEEQKSFKEKAAELPF